MHRYVVPTNYYLCPKRARSLAIHFSLKFHSRCYVHLGGPRSEDPLHLPGSNPFSLWPPPLVFRFFSCRPRDWTDSSQASGAPRRLNESWSYVQLNTSWRPAYGPYNTDNKWVIDWREMPATAPVTPSYKPRVVHPGAVAWCFGQTLMTSSSGQSGIHQLPST